MSEAGGESADGEPAGQRVLGFSVPAGGLPIGPRARHDGPEPQRFLGFPATFVNGEAVWLDALARALRALRVRLGRSRDRAG